MSDNSEVFKLELSQNVVQVSCEPADTIAMIGFCGIAMTAHIIGRDSEAGCRKVIDLFLPLGGSLSPAGDEEYVLSVFWTFLMVDQANAISCRDGSSHHVTDQNRMRYCEKGEFW